MHTTSIVLALLAALATVASAAEPMAFAQQNALVRKYCTVCHTDAAKNGGLSLEQFDAAHASPSLTAMLLSKLTGGVLLKTARAASSGAESAAIVDKGMKSGAMGAAGIPIPDQATIRSLIYAFAAQSVGAVDWSVERSKSTTVTASILREIPSAKGAEVYRLIVSCDPAAQEGYVQLAWSPVAQSGSLLASADGQGAVRYRVEGSEKMGNGSGLILHGLAAVMLAETKRAAWRLPVESLTIRDLFPGETVTFPFANLPARQEFLACFGAG